jgi:hypothetical protein
MLSAKILRAKHRILKMKAQKSVERHLPIIAPLLDSVDYPGHSRNCNRFLWTLILQRQLNLFAVIAGNRFN